MRDTPKSIKILTDDLEIQRHFIRLQLKRIKHLPYTAKPSAHTLSLLHRFKADHQISLHKFKI